MLSYERGAPVTSGTSLAGARTKTAPTPIAMAPTPIRRRGCSDETSRLRHPCSSPATATTPASPRFVPNRCRAKREQLTEFCRKAKALTVLRLLHCSITDCLISTVLCVPCSKTVGLFGRGVEPPAPLLISRKRPDATFGKVRVEPLSSEKGTTSKILRTFAVKVRP